MTEYPDTCRCGGEWQRPASEFKAEEIHPNLEEAERQHCGLPAAEAEIKNLRERNAALVAALRKYGFHQSGCLYGHNNIEACSCGFYKALASAEGGK